MLLGLGLLTKGEAPSKHALPSASMPLLPDIVLGLLESRVHTDGLRVKKFLKLQENSRMLLLLARKSNSF